MEILILREIDSSLGYKTIFYDNIKMYQLGELMSWTNPSFMLEWIKNPEDIGAEEVTFYTEGENVKIHLNQFHLSRESYKYYEENAFEINFYKFVKIIKKWAEMSAKSPGYIIIKKIDDDITIEVDYREKTELNFENIKPTEEFFNNIAEPKIKDGLFEGGLHLQNTNYETQFTNKLTSKNEIESYDIKFESDFTFNHSFFPETINIEKFKTDLISSFNECTVTFIKNINYFRGKNCDFVISIMSLDLPASMCIFDKNFKMIAFCPIFGRIK